MAAPPTPKPTDTALYDRQLRLWGEHGQACLENSNVALLNASATGTETLKNLVLPGVGRFTVIDAQKVQDSDLNNFFITDGSQGKSRAVVTTELLNELNDRVKGFAIEKDPVELILKEPNFFTQFTLIIANNIPEEPLLKLSEVCWGHNIPLLATRTSGLLGYLRVVTPEHTVIESKPDNPPDDLRLSQPWPELEKYALGIDMTSMNSTEHSHTPFVVILLQNIAKWKAEHGGNMPSSSSERSQFRDGILKGAHNPSEENFNEAYKSAYKATAPVRIPSNVSSIINDDKAVNISPSSSDFWVMAHALRLFVNGEGNGLLPLAGAIPDMTSTTESYIAIQTIYQAKATADVEAVSKRVSESLQKIGRPKDSIKEDDIKLFCKNANFLTVIRYRSLYEERNPSTAKVSLLASELSNKESNIHWYITLRAADHFYTHHGRYPGSDDGKVKEDVVAVKSEVTKLLNELTLKDVKIEDRYIEEAVRYGGSELHPIASLVGGVASQEAIKLITHQFTPSDNTFLFNGLKSTSVTLIL